VLRCVECGHVDEDDAHRWRAVVTGGYDIGCEETVVYCPHCAQREFGDPWSRSTTDASEE
jgi:hypothetical protein